VAQHFLSIPGTDLFRFENACSWNILTLPENTKTNAPTVTKHVLTVKTEQQPAEHRFDLIPLQSISFLVFTQHGRTERSKEQIQKYQEKRSTGLISLSRFGKDCFCFKLAILPIKCGT